MSLCLKVSSFDFWKQFEGAGGLNKLGQCQDFDPNDLILLFSKLLITFIAKLCPSHLIRSSDVCLACVARCIDTLQIICSIFVRPLPVKTLPTCLTSFLSYNIKDTYVWYLIFRQILAWHCLRQVRQSVTGLMERAQSLFGHLGVTYLTPTSWQS